MKYYSKNNKIRKSICFNFVLNFNTFFLFQDIRNVNKHVSEIIQLKYSPKKYSTQTEVDTVASSQEQSWIGVVNYVHIGQLCAPTAAATSLPSEFSVLSN